MLKSKEASEIRKSFKSSDEFHSEFLADEGIDFAIRHLCLTAYINKKIKIIRFTQLVRFLF
jgi:hypothetical protein